MEGLHTAKAIPGGSVLLARSDTPISAPSIMWDNLARVMHLSEPLNFPMPVIASVMRMRE